MSVIYLEEELVLPPDYKKMIIEDIDYEIETNLAEGFPLYQTQSYLLLKYKDKWKYLIDEYLNIFNNHFDYFEFSKMWANVSKPGSSYSIHTHDEVNCSLIHYLQIKDNDYGTLLYANDSVFEYGGIEDSILLFNSKIPHEMKRVPEEFLKNKKNWRYTIALDVII